MVLCRTKLCIMTSTGGLQYKLREINSIAPVYHRLQFLGFYFLVWNCRRWILWCHGIKRRQLDLTGNFCYIISWNLKAYTRKEIIKDQVHLFVPDDMTWWLLPCFNRLCDYDWVSSFYGNQSSCYSIYDCKTTSVVTEKTSFCENKTRKTFIACTTRSLILKNTCVVDLAWQWDYCWHNNCCIT